jgi:hypothetical protein
MLLSLNRSPSHGGTTVTPPRSLAQYRCREHERAQQENHLATILLRRPIPLHNLNIANANDVLE